MGLVEEVHSVCDVWARIILFSGIILLGIGIYFGVVKPYPADTPTPPVTQAQPLPEREKVKCQFDKPLSVVVGVMHYYDNYKDLNKDFHLYTNVKAPKLVWGWSACEWQPAKGYAACDIYTVRPEFVRGDPAMDTLGHEFWHGACGLYHD